MLLSVVRVENTLLTCLFVCITALLADAHAPSQREREKREREESSTAASEGLWGCSLFGYCYIALSVANDSGNQRKTTCLLHLYVYEEERVNYFLDIFIRAVFLFLTYIYISAPPIELVLSPNPKKSQGPSIKVQLSGYRIIKLHTIGFAFLNMHIYKERSHANIPDCPGRAGHVEMAFQHSCVPW